MRINRAFIFVSPILDRSRCRRGSEALWLFRENIRDLVLKEVLKGIDLKRADGPARLGFGRRSARTGS
jgi:hypothetical protein